MRVRVSDPVRSEQVNMAMTANERGFLRTSTITQERSAAGVFVVMHDLGEIPDDFQYSRIDNVDVYATAANRTNWSAINCELTGSAAGDVRVWFIKRIGQ